MPVVGNAGATELEVSVVSRDEVLAIYDSLPPRIKAIHDEAPFPLDPAQLMQAWLAYGPAAEGIILRVIKQNFPLWPGPFQPKPKAKP